MVCHCNRCHSNREALYHLSLTNSEMMLSMSVHVPGSPSKATTHLASATPPEKTARAAATAVAKNTHISLVSLVFVVDDDEC